MKFAAALRALRMWLDSNQRLIPVVPTFLPVPAHTALTRRRSGTSVALAITIALAACASKPPPAPVTLIDCPQPTAEALSAPQPLPRIPTLSTDPGEAIGALAVVIASDEAAYQNEADKREALIRHGVERCNWTR